MKFRGGMAEMMRQASRLQRKIEQRKEELKDQTFSASAGNDQVTAEANGAGELISIEIAAELIEGDDRELLQDLVVAASNAALSAAKNHVDEEIKKVTGGLEIPGIG